MIQGPVTPKTHIHFYFPFALQEPQEACDKALAVGEAKSSGFTSSFTQAFAASLASVKTSVILRAQIYQNGDRTWIEFEHDARGGAAAAISAVCPSFSYAAEE